MDQTRDSHTQNSRARARTHTHALFTLAVFQQNYVSCIKKSLNYKFKHHVTDVCQRSAVLEKWAERSRDMMLHNRRESRSRQFCTWREIWAVVVTSCLGRSLNPAAPAPAPAPPTEHMYSNCCVLITRARIRNYTWFAEFE